MAEVGEIIGLVIGLAGVAFGAYQWWLRRPAVKWTREDQHDGSSLLTGHVVANLTDGDYHITRVTITKPKKTNLYTHKYKQDACGGLAGAEADELIGLQWVGFEHIVVFVVKGTAGAPLRLRSTVIDGARILSRSTFTALV